MQDYGETSHAMKRKEKIGLKSGLGKCGETKDFLTFMVFSFFKLLFKVYNCVISFKSHKNWNFFEKKMH